MPRPRLCRRVRGQPDHTYFKPAGVPIRDLEESVLSIDEYEALRLKDIECLDQAAASERMGISQPTFHRLLIIARKKVSDALVHGKAIRIQGGDYEIRRN